MPFGDCTGPLGLGPRAGMINNRFRRYGWSGYIGGRGLCYGGRYGFWRNYQADYPELGYRDIREFTKDEQRRILEAELKDIEQEKENIEKRLKELE